MASYLPCPELLTILRPAFAPCAHFQDVCLGAAQWVPNLGQVPRGFIGALGTLEDVELVLLIAEPGNPYATERHAGSKPIEFIESVCAYAFEQYDRRTDLIHRNLRGILDRCWPGQTLREQLRKTWITETYLCSAVREGGSVPAASWRACARDYLGPQLRLLPGRVVVALGKKAQQRAAGFPFVYKAGAVSPPGCNFARARASWDAIPSYLGAHRRSGA